MKLRKDIRKRCEFSSVLPIQWPRTVLIGMSCRTSSSRWFTIVTVSMFSHQTWTDTIKSVLYHIFQSTQGDSEPSDQSLRWVEADGVKYLFHSEQKWCRKDGRDFAHAAWNYLGFAQ